MGAGAITVNGNHNFLMALYNNDTSQMVLLSVDSGGNSAINSGDNVDVIGKVTMSLTDYQTFGTNGSLLFA